MVDYDELFGGTAPRPAAPGGEEPAARALAPQPERKAPALQSGSFGSIIGGIHITPQKLGLKPPKLQIIHKKDRRGQQEEPGQMKLGRLYFDEVHAVFVNAHMGRQYDVDRGRDSYIACASRDNEEPLAHIEGFAAKCQSCPYSQWKTNESNGKRVPPPCSELVAMLGVLIHGKRFPTAADQGVDMDGGLRPFWMIGKKTGTQRFIEYLNGCQQALEEGAEHLGQFLVKITTEENVGQGFSWYSPIFTVEKRLEADEYRELVKRANELRYEPNVRAPDTNGDSQSQERSETSDDSDIPF